MKMKVLGISLLMVVLPVFADPAVGLWVTVDDDDGNEASVVDVRVNEQGELQGTIIKLLREKDQGKTCDDCPDDFHGQPVEGLTFMWGLKKENEGEWKKGRILDPKSGNIYKSNLAVAKDGQSLTVRGYIGVSWIGRSQQWLKYKVPAAEQSEEEEKEVQKNMAEIPQNTDSGE